VTLRIAIFKHRQPEFLKQSKVYMNYNNE